jgi:hypothetical protein
MQDKLFVPVCVLIASILIASSDLSASQTTYGGSAYDAVYDVIQTGDGGYIAIGNSASFDPLLLYYDVYLIKTDAFGNLQWQRTFGSPSWESGYGFNETADGGYILVGSKTNPSDNTTDVYVIKVDGIGGVQWEQTFGGPKNDKARTVQQTVDGGYIIFGDSNSFGSVPFQSDMYVLKISANGAMEWETVIGGDSTEWTWGGMQTSDGGYVVVGDTRSYSNPVGWADVYLVKLDEDGNQVWDKTYGDTSLDTGRSVLQTPDNGFVIAGETFPPGSSAYKAYLIKTDSDGNEQWSRTYGPSSQDTFARCVRATPDGGFIVAGEQNDPAGIDKDGYLLKVDALGNPQWDNTYGGPSIEFIYSVSVTSDDGYILSGRTLSFGEGNYDAFLVKLDSDGEHDETWSDLGGGTVGSMGQPALFGSGSLMGGTSASVALSNAPANAAMIAWTSFAPTPFAALGGTVHSFPFASQLFVFANGSGAFSGTATWPNGVPPGTNIWFQFVVQDASVSHGLTLSNGLLGTTP